ncbi:hypothetical protein RGQ29_012881, partial [Quercus rubra]
RGQRVINFTVDEDIKLVSAWLNVSLDAVTLTDQKHTTFWERIWFTFHNDKKFNHIRDSLNSRWSTIQRETNKFYGCLAQIENRNESATQPAAQPATQSCHTFTSSINLDEDNDEMNSDETLERPIGKKAEKEKLKKRKNCDDVKNEVEKRKMEDELMMKDTRTMDPEQKEYIRLRRLEIFERLRSKYPS